MRLLPRIAATALSMALATTVLAEDVLPRDVDRIDALARRLADGLLPGEKLDDADLLLLKAAGWNPVAQRLAAKAARKRGNHQAAAAIFALAAVQGDYESLISLSDLYRDGNGVPADPEKAADLAIRAMLAPGANGFVMIGAETLDPSYVLALKRLAEGTGVIVVSAMTEANGKPTLFLSVGLPERP